MTKKFKDNESVKPLADMAIFFKNGFEIIKAEKILKNSWIVLVERTHEHSPYVVWEMDKDGVTYHGDYCPTKEEAEERYRIRTQK